MYDEGPEPGMSGHEPGQQSPYLFGVFSVAGMLLGGVVVSIAASSTGSAYMPRGVLYIGAAAGWVVGVLAYALTFGFAAFTKESLRGNRNLMRCPGCQKKVHIPEEFAGMEVKCPRCSQTFIPPPPTSGP